MAEAGYRNKFKYLRAVVSVDGSIPEVLSWVAHATVALTKLKPIWRDNNICYLSDAFPCHFHNSVCLRIVDLVIRVRIMQTFEMRCYRRLRNIS